jgi:hypothetical protein
MKQSNLSLSLTSVGLDRHNSRDTAPLNLTPKGQKSYFIGVKEFVSPKCQFYNKVLLDTSIL